MKRQAAEAALAHVQDGCRLGLGSGSTAEIFVELLAQRVGDGLSVRCCATSERTARLAGGLGISVFDLDHFSMLDLCVDGADEIDPQLNLIKGGGACHLREKVVASYAGSLLIIADESKLVQQLGAFRVPVELVPFSLPLVQREVQCMEDCRSFELRLQDGRPLLTDEGNLIADADFGVITDPGSLAQRLGAIPGLVEHGLFVGMARLAIIGSQAGVRTLRRP